ncbi:hypothetical protein OG196_14535 [Kitasatospora purpeofusca]|uniref:hypothetical protein n=1 Tax=Kitasatospora purpeofusca TaxID=67352 RepID=UPI002E10A263|nr:hypothetical protein OG196_14535 [Kitasatospora purpeofusca]
MNGVDRALSDAMDIDGALGAALVDYDSGMALGTRVAAVARLDLTLAAAGCTDIVRATRRTLDTLNLGAEEVEDILAALTGQYHLIRPLTRTNGSSLFLYLVLDRTRTNLAMARHHLRRIEATLEL